MKRQAAVVPLPTSTKDAFHIAETRAVKLGQQSEMLRFLQALGYILSSPVGSHSATATRPFPAGAGEAESLCSGREMALPDPDTCCCAGSPATQGSGTSCPPCSATGLSCTQEALLQKVWKEAPSVHKRIRDHELDPPGSSGCSDSPAVSLALCCCCTFRSLLQSCSLNLAAESLCVKRQMLRGPDLSTRRRRRGEGTTLTV